MKCIVTAGPTYEPLDEVRRLTNFSTGRFGSLLANYLVQQGHEATLLLGHYSTHHGEQKAQKIESFTTTADLRTRLQDLAGTDVQAVFHAAAVSDFGFGTIYERFADGTLEEVKAGKISSRRGPLFVELVAKPKIIRELREWFPKSVIVGWKYEVDGIRPNAIVRAEQQIAENKTDACVANGPAYGLGFGLLTRSANAQHFSDINELFQALEKLGLAGATGSTP
jgi:phosphopantothenate---cysteine ligase (CTP)